MRRPFLVDALIFAAAMFAASQVHALSWTVTLAIPNPLRWEDGTALTTADYTRTDVMYGPCDAGDTNLGSIRGGTTIDGSRNRGRLNYVPPGRWCVVAVVMHRVNGTDEIVGRSNITVLDLPATLPAGRPKPVYNLEIK